MLNIDFDQLRRNLLLTQTYCEQQLAKTDENPASILRSINPKYGGKNIFEFKRYYRGGADPYIYNTEWTIQPYWDNTDLIEELYYTQIAQKQQLISPENTNPTVKGDIFVFSMDETLIDGAAAVESLGFLDENNCPAIDTWFYLIEQESPSVLNLVGQERRRLLLSWVPEQFIGGVDIGIQVNPENCIDWFRNWYPAEYDQIIHSLTKSE
jgi:hypothetical protein